MHTPNGFEIREGVAHATSWLNIVFNPSMPYRLAHVIMSSALTTCFFVAGLGAWRMLKSDRSQAAYTSVKVAMLAAAFLSPAQLVVGDLHGVHTAQHQPQKVAAMEGLWETTHGAPLVLFGLPDEQRRENKWALEIPKLSSLIITRSLNGEVKGINEFPGEHPPVAPVFWGFRIMVGTGMAMIALAWLTSLFILRKRPLPEYLKSALVVMLPSGWIATLAGWYVTEIGRQPWLVQGLLRTADAVTSVPPSYIALTLTAYAVVYLLLLVAYGSTIRHLTKMCITTNDDIDGKNLETSEHSESEGMRQSGVFGLGRNHS